MNLIEYIKSFPRRTRTSIRRNIADVLQVSEVYARSMCNGNKPIPGKYAIKLEIITHGLVSRHETAPELYPLEINNRNDEKR